MDPADPRSAAFVHDLLEEADALNERGAYEAGLRLALELEPGRIAARFDLALAMLADGQVDEALREYREGLEDRRDVASVRAHATVALEDLTDASRDLDGMDVAAVDRLLREFLASPSPDR